MLLPVRELMLEIPFFAPSLPLIEIHLMGVSQVPLPVPGVCTMTVRAFGNRFARCPQPEFALPGVRELPPLSFPLGLLLR